MLLKNNTSNVVDPRISLKTSVEALPPRLFRFFVSFVWRKRLGKFGSGGKTNRTRKLRKRYQNIHFAAVYWNHFVWHRLWMIPKFQPHKLPVTETLKQAVARDLAIERREYVYKQQFIIQVPQLPVCWTVVTSEVPPRYLWGTSPLY